MTLPYFFLDCEPLKRVSPDLRNSVRRLRWLGVVLCLPVLLAAAPGSAPKPDPAPKPPAGNVTNVPPDQDVAILGHTVTTPDGKTIGRLIDVLVNAAGKPEAAVIDFGGFMGVGTRKIAVHWNTLHFAPGNHKQAITLDLTLDQIKAAPEYKDTSKPVPVVVKPSPEAEDVPSAKLTPATTNSAPSVAAHSVSQ